MDIRAYSGQLAIRDGVINREAAGPDCCLRVRREQAGAGVRAQLLRDHVEVGTQAPKLAVVDLDDAVWKGRTAGIGSGLLTVRDSFTSVRPTTLARPGSGAWIVEVQEPTAPGVVVSPTPATPVD